jgi:nucleoside-diphosphate kinase
MKLERTLLILKPDCMEQRNVGDILSRFEANDFEIVAAKMALLSKTLLRQHYAHITNKPFYPELEAFMTERPIMLLVLEADEAVSRARRLIGPTNPDHAAKNTIRGGFGTCTMRNVIHASDSKEAARLEIARFFAETEIFHIEKELVASVD